MFVERTSHETARAADRYSCGREALFVLRCQQQCRSTGAWKVAFELRYHRAEHVHVLVAHAGVEWNALGIGRRARCRTEEGRAACEQDVGLTLEHAIDITANVAIRQQRNPSAIGREICYRCEVVATAVVGVAIRLADREQE